jgi:hypothetical protein
MKMDEKLNSENSAGETGGQSQVGETSVERPLGSDAAISAAAAPAPSGEGSTAAGARDEGQAKAVIAQLVEPSVEAEKKSAAGETRRDNQVGESSVAIASSDATTADPVGDALAALDRRDYATAQRLFEALGRKDAAAAIEDALAALDRKDYATAQGLFEALGQKGAAAAPVKGSAPATPPPPKPEASAGGPLAFDTRNKARQKPVISPLEVIPLADAAYHRPLPQAKKAKSRRLKPLLLGAGLVLFAIFGVAALYGSPLNWTFPTTKSQAIAGLSSAVDVLKADMGAITGQSAREEERSEMREVSAALTQVTVRLEQIEHEYGTRLDKLSERVDQDFSSRFADIGARLDKLEKKAALPASPALESADVVARLNKLEKRAAVPAASSANSLLPAAQKQSSLVARAEPSAPNEIAKSDNAGPVLRDYSVEDVRDGIAVVDSRYGPQEVAPGDFIPGAGRVLRIEKRGGDWFVLTSRGVIGSGPAPQ